jgi:hypothetical protein
MKTWVLGLLCAVFVHDAAAQELPVSTLATELSAAMRLDEFFAGRWNSNAVEVHRQNKSTPDRLTCAASAFRTEEFTAKAPKVLEAMFTSAELAEALKFYRSKLGQRWVAMTFDVFRAQDTGTERQVKLGLNELKRLQSYLDTNLGSRIGNMANVTGSEQARSIFGLFIPEAIRRCPRSGG